MKEIPIKPHDQIMAEVEYIQKRDGLTFSEAFKKIKKDDTNKAYQNAYRCIWLDVRKMDEWNARESVIEDKKGDGLF